MNQVMGNIDVRKVLGEPQTLAEAYAERYGKDEHKYRKEDFEINREPQTLAEALKEQYEKGR